MADVVTKELKVRVTVDSQTGQMRIFEADMDKVGKAVDEATKKMQRQEMALLRQQKAFNNTRDAIVRSGAAFSGLSSAMGGVGGQILSVTNQIENFEYVAQRAGKSIDLFSASVRGAISSIGLFGVGALVVTAAVTGWKIGKWISDMTAFGAEVKKDIAALEELAHAAETAKKEQDQFQATGRLGAAIMDKYGLTIAEFTKFLKDCGGNVMALSVMLRNMGKAAEEAGEKFQKAMKEKMDLANEAFANFGKDAGELAQRYSDEMAKMEASVNGDLTKLTEGQQKTYEHLQELFLQYRTQRQQDIEAANQKEESEQKAANKRAETEAIRHAKEMIKAEEEIQRGQFAAMIEIEEGNREIQERAKEQDRKRVEEQKAADKELADWRIEQTKKGWDVIEERWAQGRQRMKETNDQIVVDLKETSEKIQKEMEKWAAAFGYASSAFHHLAELIGGDAGKILDAISLGASGAQDLAGGFAAIAEGGILGWVKGIDMAIQGVGKLIGMFKELFGHDWTADTHKQLNILIGDLEISDSLFQDIKDDAEEMGNAMRASLLHLPDIFDELGVSLENFFTLAQSAQDVLSGIEQGIISVDEASQIMGEVLPQLFDAAIEGGEAYMDRLQELLVMTKRAGVDISSMVDTITSKIKEMQAAVVEQVGIINEGMGVLIDDLGKQVAAFFETSGFSMQDFLDTTWTAMSEWSAKLPTALTAVGEFKELREQALGFADIILSNFNALIAGGKSVAEAIALISPNLDKLTPILKKLGLTWSDIGAGWIRQVDNINGKFKEEVAIIGAVTSNLQAMLTAGIDPGKRGFEAMQKSAMDAWARINSDSKVTKAELATVRPLLMALAAASLEYGYALDPVTINLLKQAGLWDDIANKPDATKVQQQGIGDLIDAFTKEPDGLIPTLQRFMDMLAALNGMVITPVIAPEYEPPDQVPYNPPENGGGWRAYHGLQGVHEVTHRVERVIVQKGEKIVGRNVGIAAPMTVNIYGGDVNQRLQEVKRWEREGRNY